MESIVQAADHWSHRISDVELGQILWPWSNSERGIHRPRQLPDRRFSRYRERIRAALHAATTIMAIALLFSGTSAGIVATMAGQIAMEGAVQVRIKPFYRRLVTRLIAIIPAMIVSAAVGPSGVGVALNYCNVVLSPGLISSSSCPSSGSSATSVT